MYARLLHMVFPTSSLQEAPTGHHLHAYRYQHIGLTESELPTALCQIWYSLVHIGSQNTDSEERHNIEGAMRVCLPASCRKSFAQLRTFCPIILR